MMFHSQKLSGNEAVPLPVRRMTLGEDAVRFHGEQSARAVAELQA